VSNAGQAGREGPAPIRAGRRAAEGLAPAQDRLTVPRMVRCWTTRCRSLTCPPRRPRPARRRAWPPAIFSTAWAWRSTRSAARHGGRHGHVAGADERYLGPVQLAAWHAAGWRPGTAGGVWEILVGFWASQRLVSVRAALLMIWVGLLALLREASPRSCSHSSSRVRKTADAGAFFPDGGSGLASRDTS